MARYHTLPIAINAGMPVFTPDDMMDGKLPSGHVVIYDDDHYYMGRRVGGVAGAKAMPRDAL